VVLSARLLWAKGVGDFVAASRLLRHQGAVARFVLVGQPDPGNPDSISRQQLQMWCDAGDVEWWGFRRDMPAVFDDADAVCLPSRYGEGVPKVLLEAAACGLPMVVTDSPGCREVVRQGENGLLVPVGDIEALATALRRLIEDGALRERMGRRGREIAEAEFSDAQVAAATLRVYRDLLG
jgi:glycosyltransferase involved in cell wall biosynthesis